MGNSTVPERVNEFLVKRPGRAYCDHCIQERLGLRWRQQVQLVTATLAVTGTFRRETATCSTCMERKQVTLYVCVSNKTLTLPSRPSRVQARPASAPPVSDELDRLPSPRLAPKAERGTRLSQTD
jgi:hypothetical protein